MYEVKAIVRLDRQEDVIAALHAVPDLPGLTISMVEGVGRRHADAVLEPVDFGRATMAKIEIVEHGEYFIAVRVDHRALVGRDTVPK